MKLVSWNVNGLRAVLGKGFLDYVAAENPDILCLQETKLQPEQAVFDLEGYHRLDRRFRRRNFLWRQSGILRQLR